MNVTKSIFVIISLAVAVFGRPQSDSELAAGVKFIENEYYNSDVKSFRAKNHATFNWSENQFQAPNLIPYDNPQHIDNAREEYEGYGSKIDSVYDGLHKKTSNVFNVMFALCKIFKRHR